MNLDKAGPELRNFLQSLTDNLKDHLGHRLVALLLHGSLAMGSFYPPKSDIDLLIVVDDLPEERARDLYQLLETHHQRRPYVGGLEVSVITAHDAKHPEHPMPSLVHFSETTSDFRPWQDGIPPTDEDLIAHVTVAKHRGASLYGPDPAALIGDMRWSDYLRSVRGDIDWIIEDNNILLSPAYSVLNLCRWVMIQEAADKFVPNKEEAGIWALAHLPKELSSIVNQALAAYRSSDWPADRQERMRAGGPWDPESLINFRDKIRIRTEN